MAKKSEKTAAAKATALAAAAAAATAQATSQARAQASDLGDRLAPVVDDARERLAPVVLDARERLAPVVEDARERLAPVVEDARERLVDLTGTVATRIDDLTGTVATRIDDALPDRVTPAAVKQRVPAPPRPSRFRQALLVLGLGTVAAVVTRRLTGGGSEPTWRSADQTAPAGSAAGTPAGAPATEATASTPANAAGLAAAASAGESAHGLIAGNDHASGNVPGSASNDAGEVGPDTPAVVATVDVAGGTPEEVAADATDTPHEVTTPDQPAQKVILD